MHRTRSTIAGVLAILVVPAAAFAQTNGSRDAKIREAMTAGPASITANATIMDWPATEGGAPVELRRGTNGWTCFPDLPATEGSDPMCLDEVWLQFFDAFLKKEAPRATRIGIGYMAGHGGAHGSNTDPFATGPTATNEWGHDPPHIMIIVPDLRALEGLPTSRDSGGPWVMFRGTPYAHIMLPVEAPRR
jgi:hypothetical protein